MRPSVNSAAGASRAGRSGTAVPLWLLVLPPFAVGFGYGTVLPVLPAWLDALHVADGDAPVAWHAGLLSVAYLAGAMLGAPAWGACSDRIGRRPVLALGLAGSVLSLLLLWPAMASLPALYVARFMNGWFAASALPTTLALAADRVPGEQRGRVLAWINGGAVLGFLAGPAFSAALHALTARPPESTSPALHGMAVPLLSSALVGSAVLAIVWRAVPPGSGRTGPSHATAPDATARTLLASVLLLGAFGALGLGVLEVGLAVFGLRGWGLSPGQLAIFFTVCSAMMVLTQLFAFARLAKRFDERWIVAAALAVMSSGFAALGATVGRYGAALASVALIAAASGVLTPALSQLAARHGGGRVGTWVGWQNSAGNLGQAVGSALAGALLGWIAFRTFFTASLALAAAAAVAIVLAWRGTRPEPAHPHPGDR